MNVTYLLTDPDDKALSQRIYEQLRARIIRGDLPPGTRLRERELAEEFSVSRIPLREAMPQLESDGFIQTLPRRGAVVTQLTMRDVQDLFDVRLGIEVFATRLAAQQVAAGASTAALREAMARAEGALASTDADEIAESNADLHDEIMRLSDNALLLRMGRVMSGRDRWIFRMTSDRDQALACKEHQQLCAALYAGDANLAAAIAYSHIEAGRAPTVNALSQVLPKA
jgi:DNA-binding GntR family transcriptional regulator